MTSIVEKIIKILVILGCNVKKNQSLFATNCLFMMNCLNLSYFFNLLSYDSVLDVNFKAENIQNKD